MSKTKLEGIAGIEAFEAQWRASKEETYGKDTVALAESQLEDEANGEGVILRLAVPVGGEPRIRFGPIRVRHIRAASGLDDFALAAALAGSDGERLQEIASEVDQVAVELAVGRQMGKYRRAGRTSSAGSAQPSGAGLARSMS